MDSRTNSCILTATLLAACSANPAPVPLAGRVAEIQQLAGEWVGTYYSSESGRTGSILFTITPGDSVAHGDVLMLSERRHPGMADQPAPTQDQSRMIAIEFVRIAYGRVRGSMEPYPDPDCGCTLITTFDGTIRGNVIEGTFVSRHSRESRLTEGTWRVERRH